MFQTYKKVRFTKKKINNFFFLFFFFIQRKNEREREISIRGFI
jgi:hypothetical protein